MQRCRRWSLRTVLRAAARLTEPRDVMVRARGRVRYLRLSRGAQLFGLLLIAGIAAGAGHVVAGFLDARHALAEKDRQIAALTEQGVRLSARVSSMNEDVQIAVGTLARSRESLIGLMAQNDALRRDVARLRGLLQSSDGRRGAQIRRQAALHERLRALEGRLESAEETRGGLARKLDDTEKKLADIRRERAAIADARNAMKARVRTLEHRMARVRDSQATALSRVTDSTMRDIRRLRGMVRKTGLDPDTLLRRMDPDSYATGGPFVPFPISPAEPPPDSDAALAILDRYLAHWEDMQALIRRLPMVAPVDHARLASPFGKRRDPINKKWAMHEGIDLAAFSRTPILAPAPGTVARAGWNGHFGRFIEIDHGNGVTTRYAHLRRINVKRGQDVEFGQRIGQLGTSGRSTGAHLHYELHVDGKPVDPLKFIKAGKNVFKG